MNMTTKRNTTQIGSSSGSQLPDEGDVNNWTNDYKADVRKQLILSSAVQPAGYLGDWMNDDPVVVSSTGLQKLVFPTGLYSVLVFNKMRNRTTVDANVIPADGTFGGDGPAAFTCVLAAAGSSQNKYYPFDGGLVSNGFMKPTNLGSTSNTNLEAYRPDYFCQSGATITASLLTTVNNSSTYSTVAIGGTDSTKLTNNANPSDAMGNHSVDMSFGPTAQILPEYLLVGSYRPSTTAVKVLNWYAISPAATIPPTPAANNGQVNGFALDSTNPINLCIFSRGTNPVLDSLSQDEFMFNLGSRTSMTITCSFTLAGNSQAFQAYIPITLGVEYAVVNSSGTPAIKTDSQVRNISQPYSAGGQPAYQTHCCSVTFNLNPNDFCRRISISCGTYSGFTTAFIYGLCVDVKVNSSKPYPKPALVVSNATAVSLNMDFASTVLTNANPNDKNNSAIARYMARATDQRLVIEDAFSAASMANLPMAILVRADTKARNDGLPHDVTHVPFSMSAAYENYFGRVVPSSVHSDRRGSSAVVSRTSIIGAADVGALLGQALRYGPDVIKTAKVVYNDIKDAVKGRPDPVKRMDEAIVRIENKANAALTAVSDLRQLVSRQIPPVAVTAMTVSQGKKAKKVLNALAAAAKTTVVSIDDDDFLTSFYSEYYDSVDRFRVSQDTQDFELLERFDRKSQDGFCNTTVSTLSSIDHKLFQRDDFLLEKMVDVAIKDLPSDEPFVVSTVESLLNRMRNEWFSKYGDVTKQFWISCYRSAPVFNPHNVDFSTELDRDVFSPMEIDSWSRVRDTIAAKYHSDFKVPLPDVPSASDPLDVVFSFPYSGYQPISAEYTITVQQSLDIKLVSTDPEVGTSYTLGVTEVPYRYDGSVRILMDSGVYVVRNTAPGWLSCTPVVLQTGSRFDRTSIAMGGEICGRGSFVRLIARNSPNVRLAVGVLSSPSYQFTSPHFSPIAGCLFLICATETEPSFKPPRCSWRQVGRAMVDSRLYDSINSHLIGECVSVLPNCFITSYCTADRYDQDYAMPATGGSLLAAVFQAVGGLLQPGVVLPFNYVLTGSPIGDQPIAGPGEAQTKSDILRKFQVGNFVVETFGFSLPRFEGNPLLVAVTTFGVNYMSPLQFVEKLEVAMRKFLSGSSVVDSQRPLMLAISPSEASFKH